jgi:hypothetical protein
MKHLKFADGLSLPMDVVTQKIGLLGRTGSGKTYAATKLAEMMLGAGAQVVTIDPVGIWWGLRLQSDGKTASDLELPIFGGLHGDIPLEPTAGAMLADLIVDRALSCVLDVSQFESDAEQARFVSAFADRFFRRKKASPSAVHVFLEEAQEFVPQNPGKNDNNMLHYLNRLIKLGRNFGIGVSLVSQRPQEINKKALNQTELLLAFQMTGPQERKAIASWVQEKGGDVDIVDELPGLAVGDVHAWSPQWLGISKTVHVLEKSTFDASSTPTFGAKSVESKPLGAIDLKDLEQKMAATIEKAKQTDPKLLQREIAKLRKQLAEKPRSVKSPEELSEQKRKLDELVKTSVTRATARSTQTLRRALEAAMKFIVTVSTQDFDVAGVDKEELQRAVEAAVGKAMQIVDGRMTARQRQIEQLRQNAQRIASVLKSALGEQDVEISVAVQKNEPYTVSTPSRRQSPPREPRGDPSNNGSLAKGERQVLTAIAQYPDGAERDQLTVLTGYKRSTRDTYIQRLSLAGHVDVAGSLVRATEAGIAALGSDFEPLPEGEELQSYWLDRLPEGERRILETLLKAYPESVSRESLSEETGYKRSTRDTYLQRLKSRRLVEDLGRSEVCASANLFSGSLV